jgi:hypothetical protein
VRLRLRFPVSQPVGGFTINSPCAVLSSFKSRFTAAKAANCAWVTRNPMDDGNSIDRVGFSELVTILTSCKIELREKMLTLFTEYILPVYKLLSDHFVGVKLLGSVILRRSGLSGERRV